MSYISTFSSKTENHSRWPHKKSRADETKQNRLLAFLSGMTTTYIGLIHFLEQGIDIFSFSNVPVPECSCMKEVSGAGKIKKGMKEHMATLHWRNVWGRGRGTVSASSTIDSLESELVCFLAAATREYRFSSSHMGCKNLCIVSVETVVVWF